MEINTQPTQTTMPLETLLRLMNRRQMPVTVSPFIGYPNDPEEWCDEFEVITNLANWDDEDRLHKVSNYLSPDIRIWFKSQLESGVFSDWPSFKATFIATYPNGDNQCYILRLAKTLQRVDEDPCNYATKMFAIAQKGKIALKDYVAFVISGLQPRLRAEFTEELVDTIKDLSELMQHLREAARIARLRLETSSARYHDYLPPTYPVNAIPAEQNSEPQNSVIDLLAKQIKELQGQMKTIVEAIAVRPSRRD